MKGVSWDCKVNDFWAKKFGGRIIEMNTPIYGQ